MNSVHSIKKTKAHQSTPLAVAMVLLVAVAIHAALPPQSVVVPATATQRPQTTAEFLANIPAPIFSSDVGITTSQYANGATLYFYYGIQRNRDILSLKYYGGATITSAYDTYKGFLTIRGRASGIVYNDILRAVHFTTSSRAANWRIIYWTLGDGIFYGHHSGRYHSFISTEGRTALTWTQAKADCEARYYFGLQGYLQTNTWWWEFSFSLMVAWYKNGWIGASDYRSQNVWRWVTGPEGKQDGGQGRKFYYYICTTWPVYSFYYYWYLPSWFQSYFSYNIGWGNIQGQSFDGAFPFYYWFRWYCFWKWWYQMKYLWEWFEPYKDDWFYQWMFRQWFWYWYRFIVNNLCTDQTWTEWYYDCKWLCDYYCPWYSGNPKDSNAYDYVTTYSNRWMTVQNSFPNQGYYCEYGGIGVAPDFYDRGYVQIRPSCQFHLDSKNCGYHRQCWWNPFTNKCVDNKCYGYSTVALCRADPICGWDIDQFYPNSCDVKPCFGGFTNQGSCNGVSDCYWTSSNGVMGCNIRMCTIFTTPCACAVQTQCFWDVNFNGQGAGKGACIEDTYALCPGVDIVIPVQTASRSDGADFWSSAEALRRWLPTMPLTTSTWADNTNSHGVRIGLVMWGKITNVAYYNRGAPTIAYNPTSYPTTQMGLSGSITELIKEVTWFENVFSSYYKSTSLYANPAITLARRMLSFTSTPVRQRIVLVMTNAMKYVDTTQTLTDNKAWYQAQVTFLLGYMNLMSITIEFQWGALSPLYTLSNDPNNAIRFFTNGVAIEIGLDGMCATGKSGWNTAVVKSTTRAGMCESLTTEALCEKDDGCIYLNNICRQSKCIAICTEPLCRSDTRCLWSEGGCRGITCPIYVTQTTCDQHFDSCRWDNETSNPAKCVMRPCTAHESEDDCIQDPTSCLWDTSINPDGNCRENKCNVNNAVKCNTLRPCVWDTKVSPNECREDQCTPFNNLTTFNMMQECNSKDTCNLKDLPDNSTRCEERWCSGYALENECWKDRLCTWDNTIAPAACVDTYCGDYPDTNNCFAGDQECEWDPTLTDERKKSRSQPFAGVCVTKRCSYSTTPCQCMAHTECFWNQGQCREWQMYNMTNVDLHILFDGSATMDGFFSGHSPGFVAVMEKLREFVQNSPITKTKMGVRATAADPGYRMMFYQFGSRTGALASPLLTSISGDRTELLASLNWHQDNFQMYGGKPAICPSIKTVTTAIQTDLLATQNNRNKIVLVLTASATSDSQYCATPLQTLDDMNVQVFAVGLMNSEESTLPTAVNTTVMNLGSDPVELHTWAKTVENFVSDVVHFTDDWAVDPTFVPFQPVTMVNMDVYGTCLNYPDRQLMCMRNPFCNWEDAQVCKHSEGCSNINCKMVVDARPYTSFTCENCQLLNGRVDCQYNFNFPSATFKTSCNNARCTEICTQADCTSDSECMWNTTKNVCQRQVCLYPDQEDCTDDYTCAWEIDRNPNKCRLNKCSAFETYTNCLNAINITQTICLWDVNAKDQPLCMENPCAVETFLDCENRPNQLCKWDYDMEPPQCRQKFCKYDNENDCVQDQDHNCEWNSDSMTCREKPCQWDKDGCDRDDRCTTLFSYATGVQSFACREANCKYDDQDACMFDRKCQWVNNLCGERWCTGAADETTCAKSNLCGWDITESPSICMPDNCTRYAKTQAECTAQECQWKGPSNFPSWTPAAPSAYGGGCVFKPCNVYTNSCNCSSDNRCFFETGAINQCLYSNQVGCRALDIAIIFGVAGGIFRQVGRRPDGYVAMWEMVRAWMDTAGLTGQSYSEAPNSLTGLRIALIEYTDASYPTMTTTTGTHGRFSGDVEEVSDDIDYHLDNFVVPNATYSPVFAPSINAAINLFNTYSTNTDREKAVLFFADGVPTDNDATQDATDDLKAAGIELFTIQIDITVDAQISTKEYEIQQILQGFASEPKDLHYVTAYLDNVPRIVLQGICNPNAMVGRFLAKDDRVCPQIDTSAECNQRAACNWDENAVLACPNQGGCPNLNCIALINAQLREGFKCSDCMFVNGSITCSKGIFNPVISGACMAHPCMLNCDPTSCTASALECQYNSTYGTCFDKTCETKYFNQDPCDADVRCTWDANLGNGQGRCRDNVCTIYSDDVSCNNHTDTCVWSEASAPAVCLELKCIYPTLALCDRDDRCTWYNETCIIRPCLHYTETACINDPTYKCEWDIRVSPATCRRNNCTDIPDSTTCTASIYCKWDATEYYDECSGFTEELCDLYNSHCEWIGSCKALMSCREDRCRMYPTNVACTANTECDWFAGTTCVENPCVILNSERQCATSLLCQWYDNTSPGKCDYRPCARLAAGTCTSDPKCKANSVTLPPCVPKECVDLGSRCDCDEAKNCFWDVADATCIDGRFTACKKNMDVVFLLDGSDNMLEPMGRHSAPIIALTEFLRDYIMAAPLSGTAAGTAVTSGIRIGIVRAGDTKMCGPTNCQLSGNEVELTDDLDALANNIVAQPQMIIDDSYAKILTMLSDSTRDRVLVIVAGSKVGYVNSSIRMTMSLRNISVVGASLQSLTAATVTLQTLVKEPTATYIRGVNIDDFNDHFLDKLCNAFDFFTPVLSSAAAIAVNAIVLPCNGLPQMLCDSYPHCSYDTNAVGTCTAAGCVQLQCQDIPEELFEAGMKCENCKLVDGAVKCNPYFVNTAAQGMCQDSICSSFCNDQPRCEAAGCLYQTPSGDCIKKLCLATNKVECVQNPACVWDDYALYGKCRVTYCPVQTKTGCAAVAMCRWSLFASGTMQDPQCKEVACPYKDKLECVNHPDCIFNATTSQCTIRTCKYGDYEPCISDATCEWPWWNPVCMPRICLASFDKLTCESMPQCEYVGIRCQRIACNYTSSELCSGSVNEDCYWQNGKCYESCKVRYETEATCTTPTVTADSLRCRWDKTLGRCNRKCETYGVNATLCETNPACEFSHNATSPAIPACVLRCSSLYYTSATCTADTKCMWDGWVQPYACQRACSASQVYNASNCVQDQACYVKDLAPFTCQTRCNLRPLHTNKTVCEGDQECEWDYGADYCTERICNAESQTVCELDARCRYDTGACTRRCGFHAIIDQCARDALCMWASRP